MAAKTAAQQFEEMITKVDRLPNDMPQDFKYRKRGADKQDGESGRAPYKLNPAQSRVESKHQSVVNNLMETNNRFQTTQNTIIQQQTDINKDQLQQDRAQTDLLRQQHQTMGQMNETMSKLYLMMKQQSEKLNPKIQDRAAANENLKPDPNLGQPKDPNGIADSLGGLLGGALDLLGGGRRRRREGNKPKRQERADKRARERAGRGGGMRASTGGSGGSWRLGSLSDVLGKVKGGAAGTFGRIKDAGKAAMGAMRGGGNKFTKAGAGILAGGAALWGGKELLDASFGSVAEKHESGGRGVGIISKGGGDHGGRSYGKHQLSSKSGTMAAFLRSEQGAEFAPYFQGLTPGSPAFDAVYSELAKTQEDAFGAAQKKFIVDTHYDPAMRKLQKNGIDFSERSRALNELVFSTATQYGAGGAPSKIMRALEGRDVNSMTDEEIISVIQDDKQKNASWDFRSSSAEWQRNIANRTQVEKADLLAMLQAERDAQAGIDRSGIEAVQEAAKKSEDDVQETVVDESEVAVVPQTAAQPIGVLAPTAEPTGGIDPTTVGVVAGGGILGAAAAATADRMSKRRAGAAPVNPAAIQGKETLPGAARGEVAAAEAVEKGAEKGAAKTGGKALGKVIPGVGVVLTAAEAASIVTDDTLSTKEKAREGTKLAGGTAGAIAGGKAGAAGGAAVGAGIGAFFFGAGAVPGAAIGGAIGGIGGSIAGYMGGEYIAEKGFDAADAALSEPQAVQPAPFVAPDQPVGIFPMQGKAINEATAQPAPAKVPEPIMNAAKSAAPATEGKTGTEIAATTLRQDAPQEVALEPGKTTLMVVPIPMPAKVDTEAPKSEVAQTPVKQPPVERPAANDPVVGDKVVATAQGTVDKAPSVMSAISDVASGASNLMVSSASAIANSANNMASNVVSAVKPTSPSVQMTPPPKSTSAAWSAIPQATPQRIEKVEASHDIPMAREAFTSVQNVNVNNQQPAPPSQQPERIKSSGVAESNSIRPELKDVPPMITDFGITFINAGII